MPPTATQGAIIDWARRVLRRLGEAQQTEDAFVELKAEWPGPPLKAARRLAAHANSARGEPILWVVGADEKRGIVALPAHEVSAWWDQIEREFDRVAPSMTEVVVEVPGKPPVVALYFDTSDRPFVVRTGLQSPDREIPWREGTRTRSARRNELISLLDKRVPVPRATMLNGSVTARPSKDRINWHLVADIWLDADVATKTVVSGFDCAGEIRTGHQRIAPLTELYFLPSGWTHDPMASVVQGKAVFEGPATVTLRGTGASEPLLGTGAPPEELVVVLALPLSGTTAVIDIEEILQSARSAEEPYGIWLQARPGLAT